MMLKVRFLEKNVKRFNNGKITAIQLWGEIKWHYTGVDNHLFWPWMKNYIKHKRIIITDGYLVTVEGKATCSDEDIIDEVFGERIAEARAKITLYKFMKNLCKQVYTYYRVLLYGHRPLGIRANKENEDSLYQSYLKYNALADKEELHLKDLLYGQSNSEGSTNN